MVEGEVEGIVAGRRFASSVSGHIYTLERQIGCGAAATVFLARRSERAADAAGVERREAAEEEFAVKCLDLRSFKLHADASPESLKLRREISILCELHHPNIVALKEVVETANELFLVLENVPGGELFDRIVKAGAFTETSARYILIQVVAALKHMHDLDIMHRDLKPENILIVGEPAHSFFRIKLTDFGLSKVVHPGGSAARTFVGTPQYWAPEVIQSGLRHSAYGPEVDLWSLGVLLFVMLAGAYPFDERYGPLDYLITHAKFHFRFPKMTEITEAAKDLIRGLLRADPKKRFTVQDVMNHAWTTTPLPPQAPPMLEMTPQPESPVPIQKGQYLRLASDIPLQQSQGHPSHFQQKADGHSIGSAIVPYRPPMVAGFPDLDGIEAEHEPSSRGTSQDDDLTTVCLKSPQWPPTDFRAVESVLSFGDLWRLHTSLARSLYSVSFAYGRSRHLSRKIRACLMECHNLHDEAVLAIRLFNVKAQSMIAWLGDLNFAISRRRSDGEPFLKKSAMKRIIKGLIIDAKGMKLQYGSLAKKLGEYIDVLQTKQELSPRRGPDIEQINSDDEEAMTSMKIYRSKLLSHLNSMEMIFAEAHAHEEMRVCFDEEFEGSRDCEMPPPRVDASVSGGSRLRPSPNGQQMSPPASSETSPTQEGPHARLSESAFLTALEKVEWAVQKCCIFWGSLEKHFVQFQDQNDRLKMLLRSYVSNEDYTGRFEEQLQTTIRFWEALSKLFAKYEDAASRGRDRMQIFMDDFHRAILT